MRLWHLCVLYWWCSYIPDKIKEGYFHQSDSETLQTSWECDCVTETLGTQHNGRGVWVHTYRCPYENEPCFYYSNHGSTVVFVVTEVTRGFSGGRQGIAGWVLERSGLLLTCCFMFPRVM